MKEFINILTGKKKIQYELPEGLTPGVSIDVLKECMREAYNLALDKAIELHQESDLPVYYDTMGKDGTDSVENYRFELEKLKL